MDQIKSEATMKPHKYPTKKTEALAHSGHQEDMGLSPVAFATWCSTVGKLASTLNIEEQTNKNKQS
jgi:hypothetical protein